MENSKLKYDTIVNLETLLYQGRITQSELESLYNIYSQQNDELHKKRIRVILENKVKLIKSYKIFEELSKNNSQDILSTRIQQLLQTPKGSMIQFLLACLDDIKFMTGRLSFPTEIVIPTIMKQCNIKCKFCKQAYEEVPTRIVSMDVFLQSIEAIPVNRFCKVMLTPFTEGLATRGWIDYLKIACKKRPHANIGFNTNGSHLSEKVSNVIVDEGVKYVSVSLNLSTVDSYLDFTGKNFFELVEKNINTLARIKAKKNSEFPKIIVQYLNIKPVLGQEDVLRKRWQGIADSVVFRNVSAPMDKEKLKKFNALYSGMPETQILRPKMTPCASLFSTCSIDMQGNYSPCCHINTIKNLTNKKSYDYFELGSVYDMDIESAWKSERWMRTRALQYAELAPICRDCTVNQSPLDFLAKFKNGIEARVGLSEVLASSDY